MRLSIGVKALVCGIAVMALSGARAKGEDLATLVQDASGPTLAVFKYQVTVGDIAYTSGAGNTIPDLVGQSFSIISTSHSTFLDTDDNLVTGSFSMNVNLSDPAADFLVEQIDFGSAMGTPTGLQTVFNSTKFLGFGAVSGGFAGEYWYAFQQSGPGPITPNGGIFGGIMQLSADIKTFGVTAPAPSAAVGGGLLILGLAGWRMKRRLA